MGWGIHSGRPILLLIMDVVRRLLLGTISLKYLFILQKHSIYYWNNHHLVVAAQQKHCRILCLLIQIVCWLCRHRVSLLLTTAPKPCPTRTANTSQRCGWRIAQRQRTAPSRSPRRQRGFLLPVPRRYQEQPRVLRSFRRCRCRCRCRCLKQ